MELPYFILASLIAAALSFGTGWHFSAKSAAEDKARLKAELQVAADTNAKLSGSIAAIKTDCQKALDALRVDVKKRKAATSAAKRVASDAAAEQRGVISGLKLRAYSAQDSASNCKAATDILDQLAKDLQ